MFMPCASAVWKWKLTITARPDARGSTRSSRPWRVVDSACARSASKCRGRSAAKRCASATESNEKIGDDDVLVGEHAGGHAAGARQHDHARARTSGRAPPRSSPSARRTCPRACSPCDEERAGDAERHLDGADRVLDVAAHLLGGDRARADQRQLRAGLPRDPLAALAHLFGGVALVGEARARAGGRPRAASGVGGAGRVGLLAIRCAASTRAAQLPSGRERRHERAGARRADRVAAEMSRSIAGIDAREAGDAGQPAARASLRSSRWPAARRRRRALRRRPT